MVNFFHAYSHRGGNYNCLLSHTARWFPIATISKNSLYRLCSSGSFRLSPSGFEAHPGANTFPSVCGLTTTSFTDPPASRNTFSVSTITDGNARVGGRSTLSTLTLASLYIEPSPCGGVRPAGDPVDSDPGAVFEDDPHSRSVAGRPPEP